MQAVSSVSDRKAREESSLDVQLELECGWLRLSQCPPDPSKGPAGGPCRHGSPGPLKTRAADAAGLLVGRCCDRGWSLR